ncbi:MAG: hypothetical protein K2N85_05885 [Lachnospiraceae bacterium]|nr:hypothetical protein [Lachnospiraceae bacterium]
MRKIFRFMLVEFYVLAVLAVTTVEAKGYVERTEEKAEEQQDTEEVMAVNVMLTVENDVDADEEPNTNEESDIDEESNSNEETDNDIEPNNNEESNIDEDINSDEKASDDVESNSNEESNINEEINSDEQSDNDVELDSNEEPDNDLNIRVYFDFIGKWRNVCGLFVTEFDNINGPLDSYDKTMKINQLDKKRITDNEYDFSQVKIACLGDSVTIASNLEDEENYEQYAYPAILKDLLKAGEVYNLGIGGSSIGRYWFEPFVERYTDIPEDTDIIIVMGGYNDGFCATKKEFGNLDERAYRTFCGDLDELMKGLKENYPDAVVFFAAPPSNSLHGYLMTQNEELIPQEEYVKVIEILSKEYGFEFIDLYHTGFLDTYDENIVSEFVPDTTHGNHEGYRILAERFAGEILEYYDRRIGVESNIEIESDIDTEDNIDIEDGIATEDDIEAVDDIDIEDGIATEDDIDTEDGIETENGIETEGGIEIESGINTEDDTEAEVDTGME